MRRILFVVIPEKGHINPYIGVAQALKENGYEIGFYSIGDISEQLSAAGIDTFFGGKNKATKSSLNRGRDFVNNIQNKKWLRSWIKGLLVDSVEDQIDPLSKVVKEFKPSLIITDPMLYYSAIVAEQENTKWVAISNSLNPVLNNQIDSELLDTVLDLEESRNKLFQKYDMNIKFSGCDMISPYLTAAFTTKELIGYEVDDVQMVGPSIPLYKRGDEVEFPWESLSISYPKVYVSFGSQIYYQPKILRTIFEAISGKPIQVIVSANELVESNELGPIPDNVLLVYYAPQLELLSKVDGIITHGGANSVMEAIYSNVPLLISPICNDQFHQAFFIAKKGIGVELDLAQCSPDECWNGIKKILFDNTIKDALKDVSLSYEENGALKVSKMISDILE